MQVAAQVREMRRARHLSQRQLAGRMQVPRTYISKIENGKAIPTLGSLERLATALGVEMRQLVRDARSRREEEVTSILSDPFLAEIAALLPHLDSLHRTLLFGCGAGRGHGPPAYRVERAAERYTASDLSRATRSAGGRRWGSCGLMLSRAGKTPGHCGAPAHVAQ